jgi:polysaccharide biosynthesis protein PelD
MHALTSADDESIHALTRVERLARAHARGRQRKVFGVRVSAMLEVLAVVLVAALLDHFLGSGNRFADWSPHPAWLVVLLAASYYGTREALFATVACTVFLLAGNLPASAQGESTYLWILRIAREPLLWLVVGVVLGEIRDAFRRRLHDLQDAVVDAQERAEGLDMACDRLVRQKHSLETRIADQSLTVHAMYNASRAIERDGVGDVLMGVTELVRTSLGPKKFSLHLVNGNRLEAAVSEGWATSDRFARTFDGSSPLFEAVVGERRQVSIVAPDDEPLLRDEGLLAGPVVNPQDGEVIGMLKIEAMDFLDLNISTVQNFKILCDWIGAAIGNAQRMERVGEPDARASTGRVAPSSMLMPVCAALQGLADRHALDVSVVHLELTPDNPTRDPRVHSALAGAVDHAMQQSIDPAHLCFATDAVGGYVMVLPQVSLDTARAIALRFVHALRQVLEERDLHAMVRHRISPMFDARSAT